MDTLVTIYSCVCFHELCEHTIKFFKTWNADGASVSTRGGLRQGVNSCYAVVETTAPATLPILWNFMTLDLRVLLNSRLRSTYHVLQSYVTQQRPHLKWNSKRSPVAEWWMDTVITSWLHSGVNYVLVSIRVTRVKKFSEKLFSQG